MVRIAPLAVAMAAFLLLAPRPVAAQDESYKPDVAKATAEPETALKSLRVAPGFQVSLFAAEPLLANPVAFHVDEHGKFYVVETFRHGDGVFDTRGHMNWLNDDLKSRTVADRVAMYKKFFSPEDYEKYGQEHERIRLIEDRDGDGKADHATVFADGFQSIETGLAAGVLARNGDVYFTCIPDLWLLKDTNGDGKADEKTALSSGYGVHVQFLGHDLHGLIFGPDGKLYFSIGDRGFNVTTIDGKHLAVIDTGSVLRCDPAGKNLEVVATGLRNPQELAFNEVGDLFSVDNNSDGGDKARLVQILEGADSGWRGGYQFAEYPTSRGIWNTEKMWYPAWDGQAAYILPPLANFTDGPSGLTYYPGTGLNASQKGRFYISDFRGASATSGIRSFKVEPKGPTYELVDPEQFLWGYEVTDCDFGPDGALYTTDWVQGWNKTGKGRIWKVTAPEMENDPLIAETKKLIAEGFNARPIEELGKLLGHADMRVRLGAQYALARTASGKDGESATKALGGIAQSATDLLARLHAIWGLGQSGRMDGNSRGEAEIVAGLLHDPEAEVRAQAAKTLEVFGATSKAYASRITALLKDSSPRVRMNAALAMAKIGTDAEGLAAIVAMLKTADGRDSYLRHAAVMALATAMTDSGAWKPLADDASPAVRMAVLLALRSRLGHHDPAVSSSAKAMLDREDLSVAHFLDDADPAIVLEAARVLTEVPATNAEMPKLAALAGRANLSAELWRRVIAACEGSGESGDPRAVASIAIRGDVPDPIREEALRTLASWPKPSHRHPLTGLWREAPERSAAPAVAALLPVLPQLVSSAPDSVRRAATRAAGTLGIRAAAPSLRALVKDTSRPGESRVEALRALVALKDDKVDETAREVLRDKDPGVRVEAVRAIARTHPEEAIAPLKAVLDGGPVVEKQGAFATLGDMETTQSADLLSAWMDRLSSGGVAPEIRLDLTEAAEKRKLDAKLARYLASASEGDPLSPFRDTLMGGHADRGRKVFREKAEVQCLRCHKVEGDGGEVGPELSGIGTKKDRGYILESIALPNKQIAEGFETQVIAKTDGQVIAGIVKAEDDREVRLITAEGKMVTIPKDEIDEKARGSSAMPEDTIKNLSKGELRDLIEFLATTKPSSSP